MALLSEDKRKEIFKALNLGEYNKANIKALQSKYLARKSDVDGIYGTNTDNLLRHLHNCHKYLNQDNFKPQEFKCECGGKYCSGYPTYMKPAQLTNLQTIRNKYKKPMTITSGMRCKGYNNAIGGSIANSKHLLGQATDFYMQGVTDTLANRKNFIKYAKNLPNTTYIYGNGINIYGNSVSAPYMGNAIHYDTNDGNPAPVKDEVKGTSNLTVDGIGGTDTVKRMQEFFGTTQDGVITGQLASQNKYYPSLVAVKNSKGGSACIKKLQKWVGVTEDGVLGQTTVKAWQKKIGITSDGIFGTASMKVWQKYLNDNDKPIYPTPKPTPKPKTRTVYIGHACINEKGTMSGGKPGDQTGKECCITKWYADKWLYVFRAKDKDIRKQLGKYMTDTCNNNNIGYNIDKPNRYAAWDNAEKNGHDIKGIKTKGDTTCSQAVSMCMRACGFPKDQAPRHCDIAVLTKVMKANKNFTAYTAKTYTESSAKLEVGDILLNSHHTAIVVKVEESESLPTTKATKMGHACADYDGKAGDSSGKEVLKQAFKYSTSSTSPVNWTYVFRPKNAVKAEKAATMCEKAIANNNIGYNKRSETAYGKDRAMTKLAKEVNYDLSKITKKCGLSCGDLICLCNHYAGLSTCYLGSALALAKNYKNNSNFTCLDYKKGMELKRGDVLITAHSNGKHNHVAMAL